ncbi:hypothetical protein G9A89_018832 [Geosiphon pyriformis]|nr:hypothetical protein G9A89_018832 [Geosiphon pyriformis]
MDYLTKWPEAKAIQRAYAESVAKFDLFILLVLFAYQTMKQNTTQTTLFELVYEKTITLPVEIEVSMYPTEPITEDNFQETLLRKTYDLMKTLENKWQRAANNIQKSQKKQKKRHNSQLLDKPVEFRIEDKVLLYHTKVEKQ